MLTDPDTAYSVLLPFCTPAPARATARGGRRLQSQQEWGVRRHYSLARIYPQVSRNARWRANPAYSVPMHARLDCGSIR